ncbi:SOS-induced cell division inhibitor SulA [Mangrovibacter plantisponsor]|uniref:Cell division inhibitor SulA n=1 Tax=Mangrovibacter plantisponsor TaxID=451513 RepID=A0A317Q528_9ENTR|nr:SOS-induced cell division inhibitor SulA [Mangrovibacter plantisponsor]PWW10156.1 SOS cell division inhibitor SulA [Mangrovibacter plantisponsor]
MNALAYQNRSVTHHINEHYQAGLEEQPVITQGIVSEMVFREDQPWMSQLILLPLLRQLSQQARWQLWITPGQKLNRQWLVSAGLPLSKVMHVKARQEQQPTTVSAMARALKSGNYSVVIGWLPEELSDQERLLLQQSAEEGQAIGFIMRPVSRVNLSDRQNFGIKIQSNLYH